MPRFYLSPKSKALAKDLLFCSISTSLKNAATEALNAFQWITDEMAASEWKSECHIHYPTRAPAETRAKLLRDLHAQKQENQELPLDDTTHFQLLIGKTSTLRCALSELVAFEPDFHTLASTITGAEACTSIQVHKSVRNLADAYTTLFEKAKVDAIAGYCGEEVTPTVEAWGNAVTERHKAVMQFLRLFRSLCSTQKPKQDLALEEVHEVLIRDLNNMRVDGAPLHLNAARKAALFTLAVLGTEDIFDEAFADLYNDAYHRKVAGSSNNIANIVSQALQGLKKSLPRLQVINLAPHHRRVKGVQITSDLSEEEMREWLNGRTSR